MITGCLLVGLNTPLLANGVQLRQPKSEVRQVVIVSKLSGGVIGAVDHLKPNIEFDDEHPIFSELVITPQDSGRWFELKSEDLDHNFIPFVQKLTDAYDEVLKVGHEIGAIKGNLGNYETTWFQQTDLYGKSITKIAIQYNKININAPLFKSGQYWTEFDYELKIVFFWNDNNRKNQYSALPPTTPIKRITARKYLQHRNHSKEQRQKFKIILSTPKEEE